MNFFEKSNHLQLRWELIALVFVSLFFHIFGLWFFGQYSPIESGLRGWYEKPSDTKPSLAVRFWVSSVSVAQVGPILENMKPLGANQKSDSTAKEIPTSLLPNDVVQTRETYLPSGRLTRLPSPVNEIDLNIAEIDAAAMAGVIELTVLVKADGTVAHVSTFVQDDKARQFADLIASRFLSARFFPGEIDGKAVNSEFKVTVVSEPIPTSPAHS